jgi:Tfp pilus assembly protein PilV
LIRRALKGEAGYSLVEVMVSIILLSAAILPMAGMFDMGLDAAKSNSEYDRARVLANLKLEEAKGFSYARVRDTFPEPLTTPPTTTTYTSGSYESAYKTIGGVMAADFAGFEYKVRKQFLAQPAVAPSSASASFANSSTDQGMLKISVTVRWDGTKTYSTSAVVSE